MNVPPFTSAQISILRRFLAAPERAVDAMSYPELRGFLFAVASAPALAAPSEWIDEIHGDDGDGNYRTKSEMTAVTTALLSCYAHACKLVSGRAPIPTTSLGADLRDDDEMRVWSAGFTRGYILYKSEWDDALTFLKAENLGAFAAARAVLMFFASPEMWAKANDADAAEVATMRATAREMLVGSLTIVGAIGTALHQASLPEAAGLDADAHARDWVPETLTKRHVGRNDPCPCGSGRKFKKCCLN